jgi:hypothetical protein
MVAASVVGRPCGKPLWVLRVPFFLQVLQGHAL